MAARPGRASALDRWTVLLAAAFVVCGIGLPLVGVGVFLGTDLLRLHPPWSSAAPTGFAAQLPVVGDTVDAVVPPMAEFHDRLRAGDYASWDPYTSGGSPLGSVPNLSLLSPLALPYLLLPTWYAPAVGKLLELVVAIGGTALFCRRLGLSRAAGVLAGVVYASSGFLVTWTNWQHTKVAALVPALFWAIERLLQRRRPDDVALVAVVVAAMLLGGFPAVTGYALYAAGGYLLVRVTARRRPGPAVAGAALAAGGVLLGTALAAVQLLPFLDQYAAVAGSYARQQTPDLHLPSWSLLSALVPDAFGTTVDGGRYFGPINPVETIAYVGVAAALLAVVGIAARPVVGVPRGVRGYFAAGLGVVTVLCWFGGRPLTLVQHLPIFSDNLIYRIRVLVGLFVAVLAGLGYEALRRGVLREPHTRWRRSASVPVWVAAGLGTAFVTLRAVRYAAERGLLAELTGRLPVPAALAAATLLLVGFTVSRRRTPRGLALALLPALVVAQALSFVLPYWPRTDRADFYPRTAAHDFLARRLGPDRFDAESQVLYPSTGAYYRLRSATGHAFRAQSWYDLLLAADPVGYQSVSFSGFTGRNAPATVRSPVLDRLSVRYFAFAPGALPLGEPVTVGRAGGQRDLADGGSVQVAVPAAALRGVGLELVRAVPRPADPYARLEAEVLDADSRVLARSTRRLGGGTDGPGPFHVAVAAEEGMSAPGGVLRVRFTLRAPGTVLRVAATAAGVPVLHETRAAADGLRLAYADDVVIYQRLTTLPRVRWAGRAVVAPEHDERLRLLAAGVPADTVVLDAAGPVGGAPAGRPAAVDLLEDSGDTVRARVAAPAAGYLVVADALQRGWVVTVDGRPAALRNADHAMVAVDLPAGTHEVSFAYRPPGRPAGAVVSLAGLVVLAGLLAAGRRRRWPPDPLQPTGAVVDAGADAVRISGRARPRRRSTGTAGTPTGPGPPGRESVRSSGSTSG